jgi:hypothetical protein
VIDLREEHDENAYDSMRVKSDSVSNEIDEGELQIEKQYEQITSTGPEEPCPLPPEFRHMKVPSQAGQSHMRAT